MWGAAQTLATIAKLRQDDLHAVRSAIGGITDSLHRGRPQMPLNPIATVGRRPVILTLGPSTYGALMRKAIGKRVRFDVFKRDLFKCQYCGAHPPAVLLHVDHIKPVASGGTNVIHNLVTACAPCNLGKGAVGLEVVPQSLADKASEVREREAQIKGYQSIMDCRLQRIADEALRVARAMDPSATSLPVRPDWLISIKAFIEKLGVHEVLEAAEKAVSKGFYPTSQFKYFCGICWSKIKQPGSFE